MTPQETKYNFLCATMDAIISDVNMCGFEDGGCVAFRMGKLGEYRTCCRRCRYLGDNGCTEKILGCKFHFCGIAKSRIPQVILRKIEFLEHEGIGSGFHLIVGEKENFEEQ